MYIQSYKCISPQDTFSGGFGDGSTIEHSGSIYYALEPDYSDVIPRGLLRRMGKASRIGVGAGLSLIKDRTNVDGIILGTATGGLQACIVFLDQIIQYEEGTLTPTNFIQSTPNAVAGSLAMMSTNTGYNNTHTNLGLSFEAALLDAQLLFEEGEAKELLIGAIEETSIFNYNIDSAAGHFKTEDLSSSQLLTSNTAGTVRGEGATMFIGSASKENAVCEMVDVVQFSFPQEKNIQERAARFLQKNGLKIEDLDALILGYNGDNRYDFWYDDLAAQFDDTTNFSYKNLVGDFPTANGFAMWMSCLILEGKEIPEAAYLRKSNRKIETILIYNHYNNKQHSFILMKTV